MQMQIKKIVSAIFFVFVFFSVFVYIKYSTNQTPIHMSTKAFEPTTCTSLRLKDAPPWLHHLQDDYRQLYCTDVTPHYDGANRCYAKTLACSNIVIDNPSWCVSAECYACFNQEVNLSSCKSGAESSMSICSINNAKWITEEYECEFGGEKIKYENCFEGYRCKCDDAGKNRYPTARKDMSCTTNSATP